MKFMDIEFLFLLLVPVGLFIYFFVSKRERLGSIFSKEVLAKLSTAEGGMPVVLRQTLIFVALGLMVIALARPVLEKEDKKVKVEGLTLLVALDISGSMRSKDVYPNRLTFAKKKMSMFFDTMPSDEIGIVAFAYNSFMLAPFTSDKETLKMMLEGVDDSYINMGSTDFSALARLTSSILEEKKPRILVLFTDGGDDKAIEGFTQILKENQIDLYVVLIGTKKGAPVLDKDGNTLREKDGNIAITQRNDALGDVAKDNAGAFVVASNGKEDVEALVKVIRGKYKSKEQGEVIVKEREEYFYYPLGLGVLFLLFAFSSIPRREK